MSLTDDEARATPEGNAEDERAGSSHHAYVLRVQANAVKCVG
jgi:hypothetical protein